MSVPIINAYFYTIIIEESMTDTKLGKAFQNYSEINMAMIRWIMGITLVEIAFVFTQGLHIFSFVWSVLHNISVNYVLYNKRS